MNHRKTLFVYLLIAVVLLSACGPARPEIGIEVDHGAEMQPGESIILKGIVPQGVEGEVRYRWTATRGDLSKTEGPTVEYKAPVEPGRVVITLEVVVGERNYSSDREFEVVAGAGPVGEGPASESGAATAVVLEVSPSPAEASLTPSQEASATVPPSETAAPSATAAPTENPDLIDNMEHTTGWDSYQDDQGSSLSLRLVPGTAGDAVELGYDLVQWGYVGIEREMGEVDLSQAAGLRYLYRGSGTPATIETKLIRFDGAVFGYNLARGTARSEWGRVEIPFSEFKCWPDTGCQEEQAIDPKAIARLDFAVSIKEGDTPGQGSLVIDQIEMVR